MKSWLLLFQMSAVFYLSPIGAFGVPPTQGCRGATKTTTTTAMFVASSYPQPDPNGLVPPHVRAERAQAIRNKLLGQETDNDNNKHKKTTRTQQGHVMLQQMMHYLTQHIVQHEKVDFHA